MLFGVVLLWPLLAAGLILAQKPEIVVNRVVAVDPTTRTVLQEAVVNWAGSTTSSAPPVVEIALSEKDLLNDNHLNIELVSTGFDSAYGSNLRIAFYQDGSDDVTSFDYGGPPFCIWDCSATSANVHGWDFKTHSYSSRRYPNYNSIPSYNNQSYRAPTIILRSLAQPLAQETSGGGSVVGAVLGAIGGAIVLTLLILGIAFFIKRRRSHRTGAAPSLDLDVSMCETPSHHTSVLEAASDSGVGGFLTPKNQKNGAAIGQHSSIEPTLTRNKDDGYGALPESITITPQSPHGHQTLTRDDPYGELSVTATPVGGFRTQDSGYGEMPTPPGARDSGYGEMPTPPGAGDSGYGEMPTPGADDGYGDLPPSYPNSLHERSISPIGDGGYGSMPEPPNGNRG